MSEFYSVEYKPSYEELEGENVYLPGPVAEREATVAELSRQVEALTRSGK